MCFGRISATSAWLHATVERRAGASAGRWVHLAQALTAGFQNSTTVQAVAPFSSVRKQRKMATSVAGVAGQSLATRRIWANRVRGWCAARDPEARLDTLRRPHRSWQLKSSSRHKRKLGSGVPFPVLALIAQRSRKVLPRTGAALGQSDRRASLFRVASSFSAIGGSVGGVMRPCTSSTRWRAHAARAHAGHLLQACFGVGRGFPRADAQHRHQLFKQALGALALQAVPLQNLHTCWPRRFQAELRVESRHGPYTRASETCMWSAIGVERSDREVAVHLPGYAAGQRSGAGAEARPAIQERSQRP